jgi:hypothetical protein
VLPSVAVPYDCEDQSFLAVCKVEDSEVGKVSKNWRSVSVITVGCVVTIVACAITASAKRTDDVVVMKNGDRMTGEIKKLQRGELTFKADYMAESVVLDWRKVARLESQDPYLISFTTGYQIAEHFRLVDTAEDNFQIGPNGGLKIRQMDVLRILPIETKFFKQLEGSIGLGLNYTSGNDQYQAELTASATYRRGDHAISGSIDSSFSGQTHGTSSARNQFDVDYRRRISPRWFAGGLFDLLRSDQQSLDLRVTGGGIIGRNLVQTERTRMSTFFGLAVNREKYRVVPARQWTTNADAIGGFDFTTFRFSKTDLTSHVYVFPSLNTPGRVRTQLKTDLSYKIAKDFWWGFHVYENFDSKPPIKADKNDLGVSASISWKF